MSKNKKVRSKKQAVDKTKTNLPLNVISGAMDGTPWTEISFVDNTKYSQEIITKARSVYSDKKLEALKGDKTLEAPESGTSLEAFLAEGKRQILAMWHADKALTVHTNLYSVLFQINAGEILNKIEPIFKKKSGYTSWIRENFENKHFRYLQQARNLADMGQFAKIYAPAGKNRLLAVNSLRKVEKREECLVLFNDYPLPDMANDDEGLLLKKQIDSVITLHRFHSAGILFATFDQSAIVASLLNEALSVQKAEQVGKWLGTQEETKRPALFDRYIQDQMIFPSDHPYIPAPKASLDKILADLLNCYGTGNIEDEAWIEKQRKIVDVDTLISAQKLIADLIGKLIPAADVETETN